MKKLLLTLSIFLGLVSVAIGQNWVNTNQATIEWDPVTYSVDVGERIFYRVYIVNSKTDPDKTNPIYIDGTTEVRYTLTLTEKGSYFVGLESAVQIESINDGTMIWEDVSTSTIGWSDDPQYAQGGQTFGIRFYPAPPVPGGIRPVTGSN